MSVEGFIKACHQANKIRYRPVLVSKIAKGFFNSLVLRRNVLRVVEFSINTACQSKCEFCYATKMVKKNDKFLDVEEIREIWTQAKSLGAFSASILGGEPTLHPKFLDIISVLEPKKHIVTFVTNSIRVDEKLVLELKKRGVFLILLSLNSTDPETNDKVRGYKGHFEHVKRVIALCKKHDMQVQITIATSKSLQGESLKLIDFTVKNGLQAGVVPLAPTGKMEGCSEDELLDESDWISLRELYNWHPSLRGDWDTNLTLKVGCPAGFEKIHVTQYGDVTGCSLQPISFGNLRNERLETIIERMRDFHHFSKRYNRCLVAFDRTFQRDYVSYAANFPSTPYPIEANPNHAK